MLLASSRPHVWRALLLAGLLLLVACGGLRRELRVREDFGASGVA
jgi:hypothetical protein